MTLTLVADWEDRELADLIPTDSPIYRALLAQQIETVGAAFELYASTGEQQLGQYIDRYCAAWPEIPRPAVQPPVETPQVLVARPDYEDLERKEELLAQIMVANDRVRQLQRVAEDRRSAASAAKKDVDLAIARLQALIAEAQDPQQRLPFREEAAPSEPQDDRLLTPLEDLLPPGIAKKLDKAGIATVGELGKYCEDHELCKIRGLKEAEIDMICETLEGFWVEHPEEE